jgi:hypothetical protein
MVRVILGMWIPHPFESTRYGVRKWWVFLIPNMSDLIGYSESAPTSAPPVVDEGLFWLFFGDELNPHLTHPPMDEAILACFGMNLTPT